MHPLTIKEMISCTKWQFHCSAPWQATGVPMMLKTCQFWVAFHEMVKKYMEKITEKWSLGSLQKCYTVSFLCLSPSFDFISEEGMQTTDPAWEG